MIRTCIIGYGLAGRVFHAPLIDACPGLELCGIVSSQIDTIRQKFPEVKIYSLFEEVLGDESVDLVINATPNQFHYSYTKAALLAGKHVVVEKPFTNTSEQGKELVAISESRNLVLSVFHNRRYDGDFLTIKRMLQEKELGELKIFESHFDRYRPKIDKSNWREGTAEGSGILYDLGSHLIDQALVLFGEPDKILADVESQRGSGVDDYFRIQFNYGAMRVVLGANCFRDTGPRFSLHGTKGQFVVKGMDPQEKQLREGVSPLQSSFGLKDNLDKGRYLSFYENIVNAINRGDALDVKPLESLRVTEIIQDCLKS